MLVIEILKYIALPVRGSTIINGNRGKFIVFSEDPTFLEMLQQLNTVDDSCDVPTTTNNITVKLQELYDNYTEGCVFFVVWVSDFSVGFWSSETILHVSGYNDQAYDSKLATVEGAVCLSIFAMMQECVDYILPMYVYNLDTVTVHSCVTELTQTHINLMHDIKYKVCTREVGKLIKKTPKPEAPESDSEPSEQATP